MESRPRSRHHPRLRPWPARRHEREYRESAHCDLQSVYWPWLVTRLKNCSALSLPLQDVLDARDHFRRMLDRGATVSDIYKDGRWVFGQVPLPATAIHPNRHPIQPATTVTDVMANRVIAVHDGVTADGEEGDADWPVR